MNAQVKGHLLTISSLLRKTESKIAIVAVLILSLIPLHFGRYDRVAGAIADAGHFWFYFVAYFFLRRIVTQNTALLYILIATSGLIEIIQPYVDRDGNFQDFAVSSLGAICAYLCTREYPIILRLILTAACSLPLLFPIYWTADALRYQEEIFPQLAGFQNNKWTELWEPTAPDIGPSSSLYLSPDGELVVRALAGKEWPGVTYLNQFLSWSDYDNLEFEVDSFSADTLLSMRVDDDQKCTEFNDRFNKSFPLMKGLNKIQIPFEELRLTRSGRMMNIEKIRRMSFFTGTRERPEKVFAIKSAKLVKHPT